MHPFSSSFLGVLVPVLVQFVLFLRWLHRRMRNDEITPAFVRDIATNQHDRDNQLAKTLATLAAEKPTIVTPAQIVRELPSQIPLPPPIVLQSSPASPNSPSPQTKAAIPAEDLKPLYDFTIDCKACQAKLAAAQGDLADERQKTSSLTRERDDSLRIARGGSLWRRIGRAAKWFLIGAAAGAVATKTAHEKAPLRIQQFLRV